MTPVHLTQCLCLPFNSPAFVFHFCEIFLIVKMPSLFFPVQVGFCFAEGRPRAGGGSERVTDPQSAEGKHTGAPQPETRGGEPKTETRTATNHCRVNTHKTQNNQSSHAQNQNQNRAGFRDDFHIGKV